MSDFNDCDDGTQSWSLSRGRFGSFKRSTGGEDDHPTSEEISKVNDQVWTCTIPGQPVGKGRPRFARRGKGVTAFTPKPTASWEMDAAAVMAREWGDRSMLIKGCELTVVAIFTRPQRLTCTHKRACQCDPGRVVHTSRPDLDNVIKCAADAIQRAGILRDDASICAVHAVKVYAAESEGPSVQVRLLWGDVVEALR